MSSNKRKHSNLSFPSPNKIPKLNYDGEYGKIPSHHLEAIQSFYRGSLSLPKQSLHLIHLLLEHSQPVKGAEYEWDLRAYSEEIGARWTARPNSSRELRLCFQSTEEPELHKLAVKLDGVTVLAASLRVKSNPKAYLSESRRYYPSITATSAVDRFIEKLYRTDSDLVPPCLFVAAIFHVIDKGCPRRPLAFDGFRSSFIQGSNIGPIPDCNLGSVWQRTQPFTALLEYAKYSGSDFTAISDWDAIPEETMDELVEIFSTAASCSPHITFSVMCERILRAATLNSRIERIQFSKFSFPASISHKLYMELRTFTAESPKESWNVAQVLKEVFRIWSETKPKDFVTAKNNDDVLPLNVPLCIPIPPRISSVHSISHRYQSSKLIFDIGSDGKDRRHPQIIEFNMRLNALKWIYHPFVSSDSTFEEDYPFMLPEKQHNLPNLWSSYFFNNPLPPISHRQKDLFDLLPIEISKMILDRLDWSSLVELARSNVSIAAMAVAFDLKDKFGLICVLLRWRDLSRELKAIGKAFENSDYYAKYGRYLTDDLHFAGCNKPWGTVQKEFASFLNN